MYSNPTFTLILRTHIIVCIIYLIHFLPILFIHSKGNTMDVGFLQETKSILKSLVLSSPNGMTIDRLNRDYREVVGSWIPFQKLGFVNLELFLKSIHDTLTVTGHGQEAKVGFVSNEKLKHINEMVSRQKNTTRERKAAVLHSSQKKNAHTLSQQHNNVSTVRTFNPRHSNSNCIYVCPSAYYQNILPQQLHINPSYLIERPLVYSIPFQNVPTSTFLSTHNVQYKKKIQPEYYNKKTESKRVNDTNTNSVPGEANRSKPVRTLHNNPTVVLSDCSNSKRHTHQSKFSLDKKENSTSKSTIDNREPSQSLIKFDNSNSINVIDKLKHLPNEVKHMNADKNQHLPPNDVEKPKHNSDTPKIPNSPVLQQQNSKKADLVNTSKAILYEHPTVIFNKPSTSMKTQPLKYPIKKKISTTQKQKETAQRGNPILYASEPSELTFSKADNASFEENNTRLIGPDPFLHVDSGDNEIDEAVPEFAANNLVFRVDFPENMVAFGRKIPNYEIPKDINKGSVVGVFISEIHSPFKFWFHFYKDNHELDILMNRIELFYQRLYNNDLVIPKSCLTPGQVCAALYNNLWHRAEVLTNICNNKVKVHFVDYGTVSDIEIQNIKYLPTIFADTPMQAVRGSLSHIKPISPIWPKRAITAFLSMVSEVLLYAQIMEVDDNEKTVYMVLCDTNDGKTVQINKQLVDKGFAKLDSEWDEKKITKNGYRKRHPKEIFPTFEMLETGEYPSLFELEQLFAQGIDYEKITEKIILSNFNDESLLREDCFERKSTLSFNLLDTNPFKGDIISEILSLKIFGE